MISLQMITFRQKKHLQFWASLDHHILDHKIMMSIHLLYIFGTMTKDLALLMGDHHPYLTTQEFLDRVVSFFEAHMKKVA